LKPTPSFASLVTQRTALVLYGVLLVLPTIVVGGLYWRQLEVDQKLQLESIPRDVEDAARRMETALAERLAQLVEYEDGRSFFEYRPRFYPPNSLVPATTNPKIAFVSSPLSDKPRPAGILGWFQFGVDDPGSRGPELQYGGESGQDPETNRALHAELASVTRSAEQRAALDFALLATLPDGSAYELPRQHVRLEGHPLPVIAVNFSTENDLECLNDEAVALRGLQAVQVGAHVSDFNLRFYRDLAGVPRLVATRIVAVDPIESLENMPSCFVAAKDGTLVVQGFAVDLDWFLHQLPATLGLQVLDPNHELFGPRSAWLPTSEFEYREIRPFANPRIEAEPRDRSHGMLTVGVNTVRLRERFASQYRHLFGVAAMLVLSLGTGLVLLMRSVQRDLEGARRTENFVSAVTHELRTPLSAIRLYGEMLQDGWVEAPDKRAEYYRRIVRETQRLEMLVERVLEKGRLTSKETPLEPADLNRIVESLRPSLCGADEAPARDLVFDLAPGLPPVLLFTEGVRSIVTNLVENARKYAPVPPGGDPIRVVTRAEGRWVVIEVLDNGPGIPRSERERIFEAFYRVGNETTRTAKGTGLGLHLVALQTQAMGGRIAVDGRPGGGTVFRVHLQAADDPA